MTTTKEDSVEMHPIPPPPSPTKYKLTSPRGAQLATRLWTPPSSSSTGKKKAKALLLIVHGGGWHSGYFDGLAKYLCKDAQFICAAYDQTCCGYSELEPTAPRGIPGIMHVHSFDDLLEDLFAAITWAQKEAMDITGSDSSLPLYLFGESFGGLQVLAAAYAADHHHDVDIKGVIASGAVLKIAKGLLPPWPVPDILAFLAPYYPRLVMPATDFETTFDGAFGDPAWAKTARKDPKVTINIRPTLASAVATLTTGQTIAARAHAFPVPLLALHGIHDSRVEYEAVQEFVDKVGPTKATMIKVDTTGHQLFQDKPNVIQDLQKRIADWLKKQMEMNEKKT
eukprot:CAMPEP_0116866068 /NCGR_PEP_ID=MMETSP0418-20121206/25815_1 /TAXON_ID=1158023 /ORGANISM="Astrosyne radiata, Strain 13vi08-1A" /LENGTH=338 /DNA_ID=CAMNT_0004501645 /DNA_START=82 /DNA_END=1098 /DNA_ORIENTATION=+